jgi:sarcosine oxidase subunit gamma
VADSNAPVTLRELRIANAWNVRGDARNAAFVAKVGHLLAPLPVEPLTSVRRDDAASLWLGPRSWLFVSGAANVRDVDASRIAINAAGGALFDVSASYAGWSIAGAHAARVLNRDCPLDFSPHAFPAGRCAQSVLGHVNALFYRPRGEPTFLLLVARSHAADAWHALTAAASTDGREEAGPIDFLAA